MVYALSSIRPSNSSSAFIVAVKRSVFANAGNFTLTAVHSPLHK